ncbi:TonB-dependent receptor plug domain-containing protein [Prevotella sp. 10(H)]|uniref:TonB-dependent receptor plug domain-containing protein n=1 Tax=Prevotella sp. 10(H) TaxID=1158294 RepID=UPI0018CC2519|nr:TonB-dependent receptor plug domain-containing protein [Prevotella sp. 10(H)]
MKNLKYLFFSALAFISASSYAQMADSIAANFIRQSLIYPQEKLYVQTDKAAYISGEDIWFRAHLTDALSHIPDTTSRYVYAELLNPADSLLKRVKIKPANGVYQGYMPTDEDIPAGEYQLRCYTKYMQNMGEDYFFRRKVTIGDPLSALYRTHTDFEYTEDKKKVNIKIYFTEIESGKTILPENIMISESDGDLKKHKIKEDSCIYLSRKAPADKKSRVLYISYDYQKKFHKQYIPIPYPHNEFDVAFMPEGGNLPAGIHSRIGFKAINANGTAEDITGIVVNEKGDTLTYFESKHLGMGSLTTFSLPGQKFFAICRNKNNVEKRFPLPASTANTVSLQAYWLRNQLNIALAKSEDITSLNSDYYLVVHCRGNVLYSEKWNNSKDFITFRKEELPTGVIQAVLADAQMNPVSERLVFNINENDLTKVSYSTARQQYKKRENIENRVSVTDNAGNPLKGDFSISVTNSNDILPDSTVNILSSILLASDLKGNIESPASYFRGDLTNAHPGLDLLMMTQGWRRYNIGRILKGDPESPAIMPETSQTISGIVKGGLLMTKPAAEYPVNILATNFPFVASGVTNKDGRFAMTGFETPDSVRFIIQGNNKKGGSRVELLLDIDTFPQIRRSAPLSLSGIDGFEKYMQKADEKFMIDNGMRMIYLKEVEIVAKPKIKVGKLPYSSPMNRLFTSEDIEKTHAHDMYSLLGRMGGIWVSGTRITMRNAEPLILVDNMEMNNTELHMILPEHVDEIEIFSSSSAFFYFGQRATNGAIVITTKKGNMGIPGKEPFNIKTITPLGYQPLREFYSPKYETAEQRNDATPDLRTTIYWNPTIKTADDGTATFSFYSADTSAAYSVVIEGMTSDGKVIYTTGKIEVK